MTARGIRLKGFGVTRSHEATRMSRPDDLETIARIAIDCGFHLHRDVGPGLLASVYEVLLAEYLAERGLSVRRQVRVPITHKGKSSMRRFALTT